MAAPAVSCQASICFDHKQVTGSDYEESWGLAEGLSVWTWSALCGLLKSQSTYQLEVCCEEGAQPGDTGSSEHCLP